MPVNLKTFSDEKNIYSVDMMIAYINTHLNKNNIIHIPLEKIIWQLDQNVWGYAKQPITPIDVINNMKLKKYSDDANRIKNADLSYPVILTGKELKIVDGYHRISKALIEGKKIIKAYVFDNKLMKKFIINDKLDYVKVHQNTNLNELFELWQKNFC